MISKTNILVVDDDADMLRLLSMRLTAAGYRVSAVSSYHPTIFRVGSIQAESDEFEWQVAA